MTDPSQEPLPDAELDRLLAEHGGPGGQELDALWADIAPRIEAPARASAGLFRWVAAGAGALALAGALVLVPSQQGGSLDETEAPPVGSTGADPVARAGDVPPVAVLTSSCGAADDPCAIDEPLLVRITARVPGRFDVVLRDHQGRRRLWGPEQLGAEQTETLPLQIRFGEHDREMPPTLEVYEHTASASSNEVPAHVLTVHVQNLAAEAR